jgi:molybdate transport system substrate-binding protein
MTLHSFAAAAATALMAILSHTTAVQAAEVRVLCSGAARPAFSELAQQFERATGHKIVVHYDLPPALVGKINEGEAFDVVILSHDVDGLIRQGSVLRDSRTVLGRTGVGVAIPQGAPKPDISTVDAFKRALLDAKAIATSGEGSSGRYVLTLLDKLGIAEQIKPKIKAGPSGAAAKFVAQREVDFAVIGLPPVIGVPGVEWLGWIPAELNSWVIFTGGLSTAAKEPTAGRALLGFLAAPNAVAVFKAKGLEPAS